MIIILTSGCSSISSINSIDEALKTESILTIEDVNSNKFEEIPKGYVEKFLVTLFSGDEHLAENRFIGRKDGGYLYKTYVDGKPFSNKVKMIKNGRLHTTTNGEDYTIEESIDNCDIYYIGNCKVSKTKVRTRTYSNGVWIYKYRSLGLTWITIRTVYDKKGLILYKENVNSNSASPYKNGKSSVSRVIKN